jgi:hypothetical protein
MTIPLALPSNQGDNAPATPPAPAPRAQQQTIESYVVGMAKLPVVSVPR